MISAAILLALAPTVVNIVNFARGSEPRNPSLDLVEPLREEIALNTRHSLPNTLLFQYDALIRDDMMAEARKADPSLTEFGVWMEMCRPLTEKVGIAWRGRQGWDWDWHVNPDFLMAYTPAERERLLDEVFRLFRARFGAWPKSMGSWLLDAKSMEYVRGRYGVTAFCICREQDNTDAYGLRGGFFNGAYYPSKRNALSAAVDFRNAVAAPCFRMLTPDPIYNYSEESLTTQFGMKTGSAYTMEPVGHFGRSPDIVDWYFRVYTHPASLGLSYMQTGQENSFGWRRFGPALEMQLSKIVAERAAGRIRVERLCDTAADFTRRFPDRTPPQAQIALEDWNGAGNQSVWYNSRFYRANVVNENGRLYIRDIHVMKDDFDEPYLDSACSGWKAEYFTPPVVDLYLANRGRSRGPVEFGDGFASMTAERAGDESLLVKAARRAGGIVEILFDERSILLRGASFAGFRHGENALSFADGYNYSVCVDRERDGSERMTFSMCGEQQKTENGGVHP